VLGSSLYLGSHGMVVIVCYRVVAPALGGQAHAVGRPVVRAQGRHVAQHLGGVRVQRHVAKSVVTSTEFRNHGK
jgi:hypothetical protein